MKKIIVVFCILSILSICSCTNNNNKSISTETTQSNVKESDTTQSSVEKNDRISHDTAIGYAKNAIISYLKNSGYGASHLSQPSWGTIDYDTDSSEEQYYVIIKGYCYYYNDYGEYTGAKVKFDMTVKVPYNASSYYEAKIDYSKSKTELTYN